MQLPRLFPTRLIFDPSFAGGVWPPTVRPGTAVLGEARVGTMGLLSSLEVPLGLTGRTASRAERLAALMHRLADVEGYWNESAERDRLTTAATLLRQRDALWAEGWRGQPVSPRLRQLARVTEGLPMGTVDRLAAVTAALDHRSAATRALPIEVRAVEPLNDLPGTLRELLTALEEQGRLTRVPASEAFGGGAAPDVGRPAANKARLADDGFERAASSGPNGPTGATARLQLVRPEGPLAAAEEIAAWLAKVSREHGLDDLVLINPDATLDAALHRYGLPTTGVPTRGVGEPLIEVVDLVLRLAWSPCDPDIAQELLLLPDGPLPAGLARQLAKALQSWPAADSPDWDRRLAEALSALPDAERERARHQVATLFTPAAPHGDALPRQALEPRLDLLEAWMADQSQKAPSHRVGRWLSGLNRLLGLRRLLDAGGADVSQADIRRLVRVSAEDVMLPSRFGSEAGLHWVGDPGAVVGPVRWVVWWNFTRSSEPPVAEPEVSDAERSGLAEHGVVPAPAGARALARAERYARTFRFAQEGTLFVCPRTDVRGDESHPHPLWDELTADLDAATLRDFTAVRPTLMTAADRRDRSPRPPPSPRRVWSMPRSIPPRERVSPSSLNSLLGCTVQWTLKYACGVRPGLSADLPNAGRLTGSLAHVLVAEVLEANPRDPDAAARQAATLFRSLGPKLAAPLFLPGAESARVEALQLVDECIRALVTIQRTSGLQVVGTETNLERELVLEPDEDPAGGPVPWSGRVGGRADLLLGNETGGRHMPGRSAASEPAPRSAAGPLAEPPSESDRPAVAAVVDLKLGGSRYHYEALHEGTAHQLAVYAWLLAPDADGGSVPTADLGAQDSGSRDLAPRDLVPRDRGALDPNGPAVAYYTLRDNRLMTTTPGVFNSGEVVSGPHPLETWAATVEAFRRRLDDLATGRLEAPGNPNEDGDVLPDEASVDAEGYLVIPAGCRFCDFAALCGRMFQE